MMINVGIVEDEEQIRESLAILINGSEGFSCAYAFETAEEAIIAIPTLNLDVVLMDIHLPYEDGYGAMRKIRQEDTLKNIPIVAVTADTGVQQLHNAQLAGFNGFIGKPLNPDRFPDQVKRILTGSPVWEYN